MHNVQWPKNNYGINLFFAATVIYKTDEADLLQKQLAEVKEKLVESGSLVGKNNQTLQI